MTEHDWRPLAGWEGSYSMAPDGRVRSEERPDGEGDIAPRRILSQLRHRGLRSVLLWDGWNLTRGMVQELHAATWPELNGVAA
jgi:hypothetical protein